MSASDARASAISSATISLSVPSSEALISHRVCLTFVCDQRSRPFCNRSLRGLPLIAAVGWT
jgi:hypothetical protein